MAKVQVLGQRCPYGNKMLIRGVFTQKKKVWETICELLVDAGLITQGECVKAIKDGKLDNMSLADDITGATSAVTYNGLCSKLRQIGRATIVAPDGKKEFQVVDAITNQVRDWDLDDEGPRCNPAK